MLLDLVVDLGKLLLDHFGHAGVQVGRRYLQIRLGLRAVAAHRGTGLAGNLQHGGVFRQRMDEHHVHAFIARVHHRPLEQARAKTSATRLAEHRHAKLGAVLVLGVL